MNWRVNIRGRLFLGFGSLILLLGITLIVTQYTLKRSEQTNDTLNNIHLPALLALGDYYKSMQDASGLAKQWAYVQQNEDHPERRKFVALCDSILPNQIKKIETLKSGWNLQQQNNWDSILHVHEQLIGHFRHLRDWLCCFERYQDPMYSMQAEDLFLSGKGIPLAVALLSKHNTSLLESFQKQMNQERINMNSAFHQLNIILWIFLFILIAAGSMIAIFTAKSIVQPIRQLKEILQALSLGVYEQQEIIISKDEIGEMNLAAKKLIFNFERTKNFAQAIGSGEMTAQFEPLSDQDEMGKALVQMKNDLQSYRNEMEDKVSIQTKEILNQKEQSDLQRQKMEVLYSDLKSSIEYAKRLQDSILPDSKFIQEICPKHFVLYLPKDVVSGDFYWFQKQAGKKLFAAADCTGHGVPGAFMSLIAHNALNHVTKVYTKPAQILTQVNRIASKAFHQDHNDQIRDGMDISLCSLDENTLTLEFSGAQNSVWIFRDGICTELKGNKRSIGNTEDLETPFSTQQFNCQTGDIIYLFSDGFPDQFGGISGKKLMRKNFKEILSKAAQLPIADQKVFLQQQLQSWKLDYEQVDDILVMGIQV
jgi:serine phosphatase RsbU (regulator of sigma subunit)/HAMP domain-containing protein